MSARPGLLEPFLCGCEAAPGPGGLISVDDALQRLLALVRPVTAQEELPLQQAAGRVLAAPLSAPIPLPPFDNAAMDGYAVQLDDLEGAGPWQLTVTDRVAAGDAPGAPLARGQARRILTGAPLPAGTAAVLAQEEVAQDGDSLRFHRRPATGENIRRAGGDLPRGAPLLPEGRLLEPRALMVLASAGLASVPVRRRLRVAFFSTGSELVAPGQPLRPGKIWNANQPFLAAELARPWIEPLDLGSVPDRPDLLRAALAHAAREADLVVTTGGVSVGDADHMPRVLAAAGGEAQALRLAMKPGKPLLAGRLGEAVCLGLPGNPVSVFVGWHVFGERLIEALAGLRRQGPLRFLVRAAFERRREPGRCEFLPARLGPPDGHGLRTAETAAGAVSHRVALLAEAEGLLLIPADADTVQPGDLLDFLPFLEG